MDDYIKDIIKGNFKQKDAVVVQELLEIVEKNMSEASKAKRRREIEYILSKQ